MTENRIRCGIIGAGHIAWGYDEGAVINDRSVTHASCIARHGRTELVSICDPNEEARAQFSMRYAQAANVSVHSDLDAFLDEDLDLISICSPNAFHAAHITAAIQHSAHWLWIEKPVTQTRAEFDELISLIGRRSKPIRTNVNFFRRNLPQYQALKHRMSLERPILIEIVYSRTLRTNGVHLIDLLGYLTDCHNGPDLDWVRRAETDDPDFGLSLNGVAVSVVGMDLPYHTIDLRVTFENGRVAITRGGLSVTVEAMRPNPAFPGFFHLEDDRDATRDMGFAPLVEGTYLNLCNLLDETQEPTCPIEAAQFSQDVLDRVFSGATT